MSFSRGGLQASLGEVDQPFGVGFSSDESAKNRTATQAQDAADDLGELHVGVLQSLLDALCVTGDFADKLLPRARQVA